MELGAKRLIFGIKHNKINNFAGVYDNNNFDIP